MNKKRMQMYDNFSIVYLNGPSSAGKTTLARALQNSLQSPFLVLGIDQIIYMMPEKLNDWTNDTVAPGFSWQPVKDQQGVIIAYKIVTGDFGKLMMQAFKDIVLTLATSGHSIIVDDVSFGKQQVAEWQQMLQSFNVLWVGVTAPLDILEQREKSRGDRKIGSARWQFEHVHQGVEYDLIVDTHMQTIDENIAVIERSIYKQ